MRKWRLLLPLLLLALTATAAWAEGEEHGGGAYNPVTPNWMTLVSAVGVFVLVLFVLTKTAWKPILDGLKKREDTIRKAVEDAEQASEEARRVMAEYQEKLASATEEARAIAEEARKDAEDVKRRIEDDARTRAEETLARSLKDIERAKDKAYEELLTSVTSIAAEAASRIVGRHLTAEDNAGIVDEVVRDFAAGAGRG